MLAQIVQTLTRLGLKDTETRVYLACLHFSDGLHVHELVRQTKIRRSTADHIIKRLLSDGFLSRSRVGRRYKYFAQPPETILFRQEQTIEDLRNLLPLLRRFGGSMEETEIRFYEGEEGIRQICTDILMKLKLAEASTREFLSVESGANIMRLMPDFESFFIDRRVRLAPVRLIVPQTSRREPGWQNSETHRRAARYFDDKKFPFKVSLNIYGDSVAIYSPLRPIGGVTIRNSRIADSFRSFFNLVWTLLPET